MFILSSLHPGDRQCHPCTEEETGLEVQRWPRPRCWWVAEPTFGSASLTPSSCSQLEDLLGKIIEMELWIR